LELPIGPWREAKIDDIPPPKEGKVFAPAHFRFDCQNVTVDSYGPKVVLNCVHNVVIIPDDLGCPRSREFATRDYLFSPIEYKSWGCFEGWSPFSTYPIDRGKTLVSAVFFAYTLLNCYFHVMIDAVPLLFAMDRAIIESSTLMLPRYWIPSLFEIFDFLDIRPKCVYKVKHLRVFVQDLHIMNPFRTFMGHPRALRHMIRFLYTKLNVTGSKPFRCSFIVRTPGNARSITNMDDLWIRLHDKFKNPKFEAGIDYGNFSAQIEYFRSVKCLAGVWGSGLVSLMWMQPGTVLIEMLVHYCDATYSGLGRVFGLFVFETIVHELSARKRPFVAPVEAFVSTIEIAYRYMNWTL
jgi:hypothetical protein